LIVVFEDSFSKYAFDHASRELQIDLHRLSSENINGYGRGNFAYMFNAIPSSWSTDQLLAFVDAAREGAEYIFLTDINLHVDDIYSKFGTNWRDFVDVLQRSRRFLNGLRCARSIEPDNIIH
jgi:Spherulation-specific family 4